MSHCWRDIQKSDRCVRQCMNYSSTTHAVDRLKHRQQLSIKTKNRHKHKWRKRYCCLFPLAHQDSFDMNTLQIFRTQMMKTGSSFSWLKGTQSSRKRPQKQVRPRNCALPYSGITSSKCIKKPIRYSRIASHDLRQNASRKYAKIWMLRRDRLPSETPKETVKGTTYTAQSTRTLETHS